MRPGAIERGLSALALVLCVVPSHPCLGGPPPGDPSSTPLPQSDPNVLPSHQSADTAPVPPKSGHRSGPMGWQSSDLGSGWAGTLPAAMPPEYAGAHAGDDPHPDPLWVYRPLVDGAVVVAESEAVSYLRYGTGLAGLGLGLALSLLGQSDPTVGEAMEWIWPGGVVTYGATY